MIKRVNGIRSEYGYPNLIESETAAVIDQEKAEMLVKAFAKVH